MPALPGTVQYVAKHATDIMPGDHLLNRGDVISVARRGVFITYTYVAMAWDLTTGRGYTKREDLTVHEAVNVAVEV